MTQNRIRELESQLFAEKQHTEALLSRIDTLTSALHEEQPRGVIGEQIVCRVKISGSTSKGESTRQLTVPAVIARHMPNGAMFDVLLTDDGILYRIVDERRQHAETITLPDWLKP